MTEKVQSINVGCGTRVVTIDNAKLAKDMRELDASMALDVRDINTDQPLALFLPGKWDYVVKNEFEKVKQPSEQDLSDSEIDKDKRLMYGAVT